MTRGGPPPERKSIVDRLRSTPLFSRVGEAALAQLAALGEIRALEPGAVLIREGEVADALFVVLEGELQVSKLSGTSDVVLDTVGPGSLQGEVAALEGGRRLASVRAVTDAEVFRLPVEALREVLAAGPDVALAIITTAVQRLRSMEAALREQDKLAALGRLAAGVSHELNNPAAAALRSVDQLALAVDALARLAPPDVVPAVPAEKPRLTALERADRIAAIAELVDGGSAAALVEAGWTPDALRGQPPEALARMGARAEVDQLLSVQRMAVERISELVGAVKGYAFLDQAPVQCVDIRIGLEQTLTLLRHRLGDGVTLRLDLDEALPEIEVYGSELNQVWTNLIDNAVDAMEGNGELRVRAAPDPDGDGVVVDICDTGSGIAPEVRAHLFEPFHTTKPPGQGVGLGLHISHTVIARHGGRIEVESEPGRTCFTVTLRRVLPAA